MERENDRRQRKSPARRTTSDGLEEQRENTGDASREGFDLRAVQDRFGDTTKPQIERVEGEQRTGTSVRRQTSLDERSLRGSGRNRAAPASVSETISRHRKQARTFRDNAAKTQKTQAPMHSGGLPQQEADAGPSPTTGSVVPIADDTAERHGSVLSYQNSLGMEQFHGTSDTQDIPDAVKAAGAQDAEPVRDTEPARGSDRARTQARTQARDRELVTQPDTYGAAQTSQPDVYDTAKNTRADERDATQYKQPEIRDARQDHKQGAHGNTKETGLSYEHTVRGALDRQSRLRYDGKPAAPANAAPKRKPEAANAAKYVPPGAPKPGSKAGTSTPAAQDAALTNKPAESKKPAQTRGPDTDTGRGTRQGPQNKQRKLQFSEGEAAPLKKHPSGKYEKAQHKAEASGRKLEKARDNLPTKRKAKIKKVFDENSQKPKRKLVFEETVKSQRAHMRGPVVTRPAKAGVRAATRFAHKKVYQVEDENVGVKAAHRAEMVAEAGIRKAYRLYKSAPYRKVAKLEARTAKLNMKASYQKALRDNPKLKSNVFSRMSQKRKIKRQYAKAAREAKKAGKRIESAARVGGMAGRAAHRIVRNPLTLKVLLIVGAILLLVVIISSLFASCSNMWVNIGGVITGASYLAPDEDVDDAELCYTEWETDLLIQVGSVESDWPGYDEYRYQIDSVGHDPYELMAFLTATLHEFTFAEAEPILRQVFAEQYTLTFTPSVETRYADPEDADGDGDYEPYEWHILTVTLESRPFSEVILPRMELEERQHFGLLMQTKGSRQYVGSPFDFNWLPYVGSYYGYRIHPVTGAKDYHMGVDIGVPTGTDILAAHDGTVSIGNDPNGYGIYITLTGEDGVVTRYGHLDSAVVGDGQTVSAGDVIAKSGNTGRSTGPHLHFEVIKDGRHINPLYFAITNDTGDAGSSPPVFGYVSAPMGDGSYAALIEEAEKFLGWPYVWGGSSPETSFDCSGYVSWVLTQSGVKNTGRLGAQALYNTSTPIPASEAMPGDLIFFTKTYSAPLPVTHVGIYVGNGQMIHCGNPIQYTSINTTYWQEHFYSFGRVN